MYNMLGKYAPSISVGCGLRGKSCELRKSMLITPKEIGLDDSSQPFVNHRNSPDLFLCLICE